MLEKLQAIREKFLYLEEQLSDPGIVADMDKSKKVNKEYKKLQPIVTTANRYEKVLNDMNSAKDVLNTESDPEMRDMAKEEIAMLQPELDTLEEELKVLLTPRDPEDEKDVIFEIRSGTGGDEAALFAGDLYRMYS
ncbi:MAG: peptide chain release factor 1, partial [Bacteroidota bacterium]